jgi:hypothetical protein
MVKAKSKTAKKEGLKKHQSQEKAKKKAIKDRKRVELPEEYRRKK